VYWPSVGTVTTFDLSPRLQDDAFAFRYTGYVTVPVLAGVSAGKSGKAVHRP
jgi:hypothetical protein